MFKIIPVIIESLATRVSSPYYAQNHLVRCIKEWTPVGEDSVKVGYIGYCVNHSLGVLEYYEPFHLYVIADEKPKVGDYIPVRDNMGKFISYTKCTSDEQFINSRIIASSNHDLLNKRCLSIGENFLRKYGTLQGKLQKTSVKIPLSSLDEFLNYEGKINIYHEDHDDNVSYREVRKFLERNIIPDGNPALILSKLDEWYQQNQK